MNAKFNQELNKLLKNYLLRHQNDNIKRRKEICSILFEFATDECINLDDDVYISLMEYGKLRRDDIRISDLTLPQLESIIENVINTHK